MKATILGIGILLTAVALTGCGSVGLGTFDPSQLRTVTLTFNDAYRKGATGNESWPEAASVDSSTSMSLTTQYAAIFGSLKISAFKTVDETGATSAGLTVIEEGKEAGPAWGTFLGALGGLLAGLGIGAAG